MYAFLSTIHVADCVLLIIVVLLQSSKGGGLAGAFGGQSTQAVFGGRGAGTFLSRATTVLAIIFMLTSLAMTMQGGGRSRRSALAAQAQKEGVAAPFVPQGATPTEGAAGAAGEQGSATPLGADAIPGGAPATKTTSPEEPAPPPSGGGN